MALIIEDGTGVINANSYVTDSEAQAWLTPRGKLEEWMAIGDDAEREVKLIEAADFLNRLDWHGAKLSVNQTMALPRALRRVGIRDELTPNGRSIDELAIGIPVDVKTAQIMLALQAVDGPLEPAIAGPLIKKERKKLEGVGEKEFEYSSPSSSTAVYPWLEGLIGRFLGSTPGGSIQVARRLR